MTNTHAKAVFNNRLRICIAKDFYHKIITKMSPPRFLRRFQKNCHRLPVVKTQVSSSASDAILSRKGIA